MEFYNTEYAMDKKYAKEIAKKVNAFSFSTKTKIHIGIFILSVVLSVSCSTFKRKETKAIYSPEKGTFGYDVEFLRSKDDIIILKNNSGKAQIIVSPKYQGKVFTSTAQGLEGKSFGWINYVLISKDTLLEHMNGYGSENRLWIGPEGGQFSVFFKPGGEMNFDNWFTPASFDTEPWELISGDDKAVFMGKNMVLENYSGTKFKLKINRNIFLLGKTRIEDLLQVILIDGVDWVGYKSENTMTNTGENEWTRESGALSIWMLDMFLPGENITVVIPFNKGEKKRLGPIATTNYFGEISPERIKFDDSVIYFKVDGKKRKKLGLAPGRAKPVSGSYDEDNQVLTVVHYSIPPGIFEYVNQLWPYQEYPFTGDVMNSYNDGPLENGTQMGPFYEIESSSPAAFLAPGGSITHEHSVFHFMGEEEKLNKISEAVFGVTISDIKAAF